MIHEETKAITNPDLVSKGSKQYEKTGKSGTYAKLGEEEQLSQADFDKCLKKILVPNFQNIQNKQIHQHQHQRQHLLKVVYLHQLLIYQNYYQL